MATTGVGFRWLDILEKEFDKACVELDTSLVDLEAEEPEVVFTARQKIATLGSCFSQLTHKALTIFQNSAKIEAELVDMRAELVQARAASAGGCQESGDAAGNVTDASRARSDAAQLARENAALRETVLALHSELFGARLATKYLDKELAGRIQQLQLLGKDMRSEVRDSLWAQVEAEILLQRHKTLVRVCRGLSPWPARPPPLAAHSLHPHGGDSQRARPRTVRVRRSPHLGLGISVTGGREHGVPILISELEAGGPAALTGQLYVGDAILAINEVDLTQACHKEAVQALQSVKGDCALCVQFIATDDDDRLSEDNYRFPLYPEDGEVFEREPDGSGATPTAPRTPDYNRRDTDAESGSSSSHAAAAAPYPDYNNINNNLDILDMDDHSIKIEARLEFGVDEWAAPPVGLSNHRYSSGESPRSTPVHARPLAAKKKRKPQDWRTKGAYRPVDMDAPSSDEPQRDPPVDITPESDAVSDSPVGSPPSPPPAEPDIQPLIDVTASPVLKPPHQLHQVTLPQVTLPQQPLTFAMTTTMLNGDAKPGRRESKGFRIGTARRVVESPAPAPLTNGEARGKFPRLRTGDGDPDFGTPGDAPHMPSGQGSLAVQVLGLHSTGYRNRGRPPSRWVDDIHKTVGRTWFRLAQDREEWQKQGEAYAQQWVDTG